MIKEQSRDQAGFRPGFSCEDHLFTVSQVLEKANEFNIPIWAVVMDFKKAFDMIDHDSIWQALHEQGVQEHYIDILKKLYKGQSGQVIDGQDCSRKFTIERGSRQGDPISPLLFNSVLEMAMRKAKMKWAHNGAGFPIVEGEERLSNLRFADDVMVFATSLPEARDMLADLMKEAGEVGLEVHLGKTSFLSNGIDVNKEVRSIEVCGSRVEVLEAGASTMYLGRALAFQDSDENELKHRLKRAWAKFGVYRNELTNKRYSLFDRMKLFNAVVTPTVLYGSGS